MLERARRRFVRKPDDQRLHHVRTASRRLRSLLEDTAYIVQSPALLRSVKRTAKATDAARDATVIRELLERCVAPVERHHALELLRTLRAQEQHAMERACKRLQRLRYPV